jgi:hypothetical protein
MLHTCREFTRLTPKVKDIVFVATFKVMFRPLVDKIPGFGEHKTTTRVTELSGVI